MFNRFVTVGGGITSLPTVRSTEGQFPYWLGVDGRLIADEFFRGSYTNGVWVKGDLPANLKYNAMLATNLSILGVSASQSTTRWTRSRSWCSGCQRRASSACTARSATSTTTRRRDARGRALVTQPGGRAEPAETNAIENSQIRLTDGSVVFTPDLFGKGITVNTVDYTMTSIDAGIKYKGLSLEGE